MPLLLSRQDAESELVAAMQGGKMDVGPSGGKTVPLRGVPLPQVRCSRVDMCVCA